LLKLTEPTSGLDGKLSKALEDTLMEEIKDHTKALKAIIWITHSEEQAERVGTRFMQLTPKGIEELHRSEP
jgi:ABC-type iron transport system FetAB ATPase subunit